MRGSTYLLANTYAQPTLHFFLKAIFSYDADLSDWVRILQQFDFYFVIQVSLFISFEGQVFLCFTSLNIG